MHHRPTGPEIFPVLLPISAIAQASGMTKKSPKAATTPGQRVRAAYQKAGMTRMDLHRASGIDYATIILWEKGGNPTLKSLKRVAQATGVPLSELTGDESVGTEVDWIAQVSARAREIAHREGASTPAAQKRSLELAIELMERGTVKGARPIDDDD